MVAYSRDESGCDNRVELGGAVMVEHTCDFLLQWNPVNTDTKGTCHSVCIIQVSVLSGLSEKTSGARLIDIQTKADSFTRKLCLIS